MVLHNTLLNFVNFPSLLIGNDMLSERIRKLGTLSLPWDCNFSKSKTKFKERYRKFSVCVSGQFWLKLAIKLLPSIKVVGGEGAWQLVEANNFNFFLFLI